MKGPLFRRFEVSTITMSYHASIYAHSLPDLASILGRISFICRELCIVVLWGTPQVRPGRKKGPPGAHAVADGLVSWIVFIHDIHLCVVYTRDQ